jgi:hypothetical protein
MLFISTYFCYAQERAPVSHARYTRKLTQIPGEVLENVQTAQEFRQKRKACGNLMRESANVRKYGRSVNVPETFAVYAKY